MISSILSIGGSDSSSGAGIQKDLKTCAALGVYGTCAITAITAQNPYRVTQTQAVTPDLLAAQIEAIDEAFTLRGIKTGMLFSAELIGVILEKIPALKTKPLLLVDPVIVATSGATLLKEECLPLMKRKLFPLATVITPNIPEMERLTNRRLQTEDSMIEACRSLYEECGAAILLKGGHRTDCAHDILYTKGKTHIFPGKKIPKQNIHGTGCALATALTCYLSQGESLQNAITKAKAFITDLIHTATALTDDGDSPNILKITQMR